MWIKFLGPFLSILPWRWRRALPFYQAVPWVTGVIISGIAETILAIIALAYWYSYSVTTWVSRMLDSALSQSAPTGITDHEVGFAALVVLVTHPLTWVILFFVVEGMVRMCGGLTDTVLAVFPLYLFDKIISAISRRGPAPQPGVPAFAQSNVSSYVGTMRDSIISARFRDLPDEHLLTTAGSEELLEIRSSNAKKEWDPPRVVRYQDRYYSLEEFARGSAPRPFIYRLRRLPAGVPSRRVLIYDPEAVPVVASR